MAFTVPCIAICKEEVRDDMNLVFTAMGRGPEPFGRPLCAKDPLATPETPPTHRLMGDMSSTDEMAVAWLAMAQTQTLPTYNFYTQSEIVWGEDGVVDEVTAQAAIAAGNFLVFPAGGLDENDQQQKAAWLASALDPLDLQYVPDDI